ncbi:MAG: hypothetical protein ACKOX6_17820 [Bdellovibrio sp.]
MKHFFALMLVMTSALSAQASVSKKEFITDFVNQTHHHLMTTNRQRSQAHKQIYCSSLSDQQIQMVEDLLNENPEITVENFSAKLAKSLKCYESSTGDQKAYVMDTLLIREVIEGLNNDDSVDGSRKLLDSYSN